MHFRSKKKSLGCETCWMVNCYQPGLQVPNINFANHPGSPAPPVWNGQCVKDSRNPNRLLPYSGGRANDRTPSNCIALCKEQNFQFAGVQDRSECYCGDTAPASQETSGCNRRCPGDRSESCGGAWRMNVYSTTGGNDFS